MKATLAIAWLRIRGVTYRYLLCSPETTPHFGHPTFDYMAYFGFGSGDFKSKVPQLFIGAKVRVEPCTLELPLTLAYVSTSLAKSGEEFKGFYTTNGNDFFELVLDENGKDLTTADVLDWSYYTPIGSMRDIAYDHIKTFDRRHVLFDTPEEQHNLLDKYATLVRTV